MLTLTCSLPAVSSSSISQLLSMYEDEFLDVVNAKQSLLQLKHKGVISPDVKAAIDRANDEDAKYILFEHLEKNATVDTLRVFCEVAIAADGFPRMQDLGRKLVQALSPAGWSELYLLLCMSGRIWAGACLHCTCAQLIVTIILCVCICLVCM